MTKEYFKTSLKTAAVGNPITTISGVISALLLTISQIILLFDSLPETNPDWLVVMGTLSMIIAFVFSSDSKKEAKTN